MKNRFMRRVVAGWMGLLLAACSQESGVDDDATGVLDDDSGSEETLRVSGSVTHGGEPLAEARVRLQGDGEFVVTDAKGLFLLEFPADPRGGEQWVTAGKDGYMNRGLPLTSSQEGVILDLPAIPVDDPSYAFQSVETGSPPCNFCHVDQLDKWVYSQHAQAVTDPLVLDQFPRFVAWWQRMEGAEEDLLFAGPFNDPDDKGDLGQTFAEGGTTFRVMADNTRLDECARCHSVPLVLAGRFDFRPQSLKGGGDRAMTEGVSCDVCHKARSSRHESEDDLVLPGVDALELHRPGDGEQVMFGQYDDVVIDVMQGSYAEGQTDGSLCAACHSDARVLHRVEVEEGGDEVTGSESTRIVWGEDTFREWRFDAATLQTVHEKGIGSATGEGPFVTGDNYSGRALTCMHCHMQDPPPDPETLEVIEDYDDPSGDPNRIAYWEGAVLREAETLFPHRFEGRSPRFIRWAVETFATADLSGEEVVVQVSLENRHTGHTFPSGLPDRNVLLRVEARDANGALVQTGGPRLPAWASGTGIDPERDYAGQAGKGYARRLRDVSGNGPVFYIMAVGELEPEDDEGVEEADNRVLPGEVDSTEVRFQFRGEPVTITVTVLHRLRFKPQFDGYLEGEPDADPLTNETVGDVMVLEVGE